MCRLPSSPTPDGTPRALLGRRASAALLLAGLLVFPGCARLEVPRSPRWQRLAGEAERPPVESLALDAGDAKVFLDPVGGARAIRVGMNIPPGAWRAGAAPGLFESRLALDEHLAGLGLFDAAGRPLAHLDAGRSGSELAPGSFRVRPGRLLLCSASGRAPEQTARLSALAPLGSSAEDREGQAYAALAEHAGEGFLLVSGGEVRVEIETSGPARLSFFASLRALRPSPESRTKLVVRQNGRVVHAEEVFGSSLSRGAWFECPLPAPSGSDLGSMPSGPSGPPGSHGTQGPQGPAATSGDGRSLRFELEGDPARALVLAPVVGPARTGRPGERPWRTRRSDLVLVILDPFSPATLTSFGGPGGAPGIDRIARESVRYLAARAPAAWAIARPEPAREGGEPRHPVPPEVFELARRLSLAGYRTGAVGDAGLPSGGEGSRGFAWLESCAGLGLEGALAAGTRFLEADDGRPAFLLVVSARAHALPPADLVEARAGVRGSSPLMLAGGPAAGLAPGAGRSSATTGTTVIGPPAPGAPAAPGLSRLDELVSAWVREIGDRGALDRGYLALTSTRSEDAPPGPWYLGASGDRLLRVPLIVRGPGLSPHAVTEPASLASLPGTLAELAGVRGRGRLLSIPWLR